MSRRELASVAADASAVTRGRRDRLNTRCCQEEHAAEISAGRQPRELKLDEFKVITDRVQVAACLVDLSQRVFVVHVHVMPE